MTICEQQANYGATNANIALTHLRAPISELHIFCCDKFIHFSLPLVRRLQLMFIWRLRRGINQRRHQQVIGKRTL